MLGTLGAVILGVIAVAVIIGVMVGLMGLNLSPIQDGTYAGSIIDYSHQRGLIFQTNDVTTKTHERSSQREDWCVPDNRPELVEKVRTIGEGTDVRIDYHAPLWIWPGTCQSGLKVIDSIEVINETE